MGSSRNDLKSFPEPVQKDVGHALYAAQMGEIDWAARPMKGFGGARVLEIVARHMNNTYRVVYTTQFPGVIYILHTFQKKSKHGIATPRREVLLIGERLAAAEVDYGERKLER